jgi:hypothetical protein
MAKKKFQPPKYDKISLESDYLAAENPNLSKFFRERNIPLRTGVRMSAGWPEKWKTLREKGLKAFQNKLAREIAEQAETRLKLSKGIIKKGADKLFPDGKTENGLQPTTAKEAAQLIELGHKLASSVTESMQTAVRIEVNASDRTPQSQGEIIPGPTGPVVTVKIMGPPNNRDTDGE